ncbi:MAG TPA: dephospho-CoA kinase [Myxococcaceae bacterium]|jgi:dephospho-CoA kinase|nr:dephospho-CoA kinase [Myxococcaceae bacterium]
MRLIGLTGGIGSGKSTVSGMLRALGAEVIDADELAREVVRPGEPALAEIARRFPGTVDAGGRLDRAALAGRIFADPGERAALNGIVHPRIQAEVQRRTAALAAAGAEAVIYDAALLMENGLHRAMDAVIVVWVPLEVQRERLMARDGLDRAAAEERLRAQMPLDEKRALATWVVDNSGSREDTRRQVEAIWGALARRGG